MNIDVSRFRIIHGGQVLNALCIMEVRMPENFSYANRETIVKPQFLEVLAINTDGEVISIYDEAWTFQFVPIVQAPGQQA